MNDIFRIAILIIKKKFRILTETERLQLKQVKREYSFLDNIRLGPLKQRISEYASIDKEAAWNTVLEKLERRKKKSRVFFIPNPWFQYVAAASVIVLFSISYMIIGIVPQENTPDSATVNTVIKTGTDKAILTLEDGSEVILGTKTSYQAKNSHSNGKQIIYKPRPRSEAAETAYNYLTIPRGGQFFIQLPDGTKVWLNSESRLKYPVAFAEGKTRRVELLYGEAYFEVSPGTNHKGARFKVQTQVQEVEVLGTKFNIKAYQDESNIYTTLVEGKVAVSITDAKQVLVPSQQLDVDLTNNHTTISHVDVYNEISWKKGLFSFKSMPLKEIAKVLSRWYDVEMEFTDTALEEVRFNGVVGKNQDLEDILKIIQNTNYINAYEIKNRRVTIK